jgi:hypothetical protein
MRREGREGGKSDIYGYIWLWIWIRGEGGTPDKWIGGLAGWQNGLQEVA